MKLLSVLLSLLVVAGASVALASVEQSTWGAVKGLYRSVPADKISVVPPVGSKGGQLPSIQSFPFPGGDWSSRVVWEARYALSGRADGTSNWPISADWYGPRWLGDWNYVASDPYGYAIAVREAGGYVGPVSDDSSGHHRGGWCTFFVRLVLCRATYWAGYGSHLTMPDPVYGHMDWMRKDFWSPRPGWIAFDSSRPHVGVLDQLAKVNGSWGWWMIDSNWVGSDNGFVYFIGRHFVPMSTLTGSYSAWCPTLATSN